MSKSGNLAALVAILNPADPPTLYYAEDPPYLPRILVFYWPVQAVGSLVSTSRIRTTILSAAGFKSFGAFSVSPSSAYYNAVHKLPEEKQRDEVCRGIAFSLCRYFSEVPSEVKAVINDENVQHGIRPMWGQSHAAQITCRLSRVVNIDEIIEALRPFSKDRPPSPSMPLRPLSSIRKTRPSVLPPEQSSAHPRPTVGQMNVSSTRSPSSQTRRTPSYSTPVAKPPAPIFSQKVLTEQLESLRFKMCEFVDTEDRYLSRLQELIDVVMTQSRTPKSLNSKFSSFKGQKTVNAMLRFPALLDQIRELNLAFLDDIEASLQASEEPAMAYLEHGHKGPDSSQSAPKDPVGVYAFARVLLNHFPKFPHPYREYLDLHSQISSNLDQFLKEGTRSIQQAPSLLMEPAQRISRYGLYIDTMIPLLPPTSTMAQRTFEKARKIIAEICEMEPAASAILDGLRIEHEARRRPLSPTKLLSNLTRSAAATTALTTNTMTIREAPPSLNGRETPKLLPSLSRSFSRKSRPRPVPPGPLAERDLDQANNLNMSTENRPLSKGSVASSSSTSASKRPPSNMDGGGFAGAAISAEQQQLLKFRLERAEEENYRLLQENAELKRRLRMCTCGTGR